MRAACIAAKYSHVKGILCFHPPETHENTVFSSYHHIHGNIRVAPLDNLMIYKDIIRLDRPD
ncbi:MAG: hypothetical protein [Olavius algarvensis Gamma 1 endosymbiont]|nr:MAG: hypothetical protein [Olavius algarvensis Gamma 1 endosymbiont]